jgi:hypothetical protein
MTELALFTCEEAVHLPVYTARGVSSEGGEHHQRCRACGKRRRGVCRRGQIIEWEDWVDDVPGHGAQAG